MPKYFFDIHDGAMQLDEHGCEFASLEEVRMEAKRLLPTIARDEVPKDGDRQAFTVLVSDAERRPVYTASLTFTGLWLTR